MLLKFSHDQLKVRKAQNLKATRYCFCYKFEKFYLKSFNI